MKKNNSEQYNKAYEDLQQLLTAVKQYKHLCIYSAGNRAKELLQMSKSGFWNLPKPEYFLVTDMQGNREFLDNPQEIDGIPVYALSEIHQCEDAEQTAVLVVAMEHYHEDIQSNLKETKYTHIFYLTDVMERILIAEYMQYYFTNAGLSFEMTEMFEYDWYLEEQQENADKLMTYMVKCAKDEALKEQRKDRVWVTPIQAGAVLATQIITDVTDASGDNISEKNPYYNEMTGLYWVWKNTEWDYAGICHYRRQFESDVVLKYVLEDRVDVVLPMPTSVYPDLQGYYRNWGEPEYYKEMLQVIHDLEPDYYETAVWCAEYEIFIPNNICIAKRKILEDYCEFAFKVIDELERRMALTTGTKQKRCWESEHVSTIYFMKHNRDYRMVFSNLKRYW